MKFVSIYLAVYFVLIAGAIAALWSGGALREIPGIWLLVGLMIAVGLGVLLAVSTGMHQVSGE